MKKYKLTQETNEQGLHRIRALRDIPLYGVKKGDLGGFVEEGNNLSQKGDCWIADDAIVRGHAIVRDEAIVSDDAIVRDHAIVRDDAIVIEHAIVRDHAIVEGYAIV